MRSSKSRSRNKQSRNNRPTGGNIINRVFDSSGPDGKVRGTPQQIIEKYTQLHRDAQLSNDRIAAENFAQHAEHYTRMLAEAMREVDRAREEQEQYTRDRQSERDRERAQRLRAQEDSSGDPAYVDQTVALGVAGFGDQPEADLGLVYTPEDGQPRRDSRQRDDRPRDDRPRDDRPRDDRPREDRARDDRPREDRARVDRPRDDRPRDDRPREDRPREDRRDDRQDRRDGEPRPPRQERPAPVAAPAPEPVEALPAFLTTPSFAPPSETTDSAAPEAKPKVRRPRKPRDDAGQPEAAE